MKSRHRGRRTVTALLALMLLTTGCLGPGNTTGRLLQWNKSFEGEWSEEGMFILLLPAYIVTSLGDVLIFNSIQFWTGKNPVDPPRGDGDSMML